MTFDFNNKQLDYLNGITEINIEQGNTLISVFSI